MADENVMRNSKTVKNALTKFLDIYIFLNNPTIMCKQYNYIIGTLELKKLNNDKLN